MKKSNSDNQRRGSSSRNGRHSHNYTRGASRRKRRFQVRASIFLILFCAVVFIGANYMLARDKAARQAADHEGDLTAVVTNPGLEEIMIEYDGMTVSFNPELHIPNWVAWELTADEVGGDVSRAERFLVDPDVIGCPNPSDYSRSGYDRGHMAPAGDMKWSEKAMGETFFMTNICPQVDDLNRGAWKRLEEKCRAKTSRDSALIIVCGPVLTDSITKFIGASRVAVPRRFFKVVLSPYADPPQAIGFIMPNGYVEGGMQKAATSVDEVEALTGHDFFHALDDDIESKLESKFNFPQWSRTR